MPNSGKTTTVAAWAGLATAVASLTPQIGNWIQADAELRNVRAEQIALSLAQESLVNDERFEEIYELINRHAEEIQFLEENCVSEITVTSSSRDVEGAPTPMDIARVVLAPESEVKTSTIPFHYSPEELRPQKKRRRPAKSAPEVQKRAVELFR